jgi:hypothetical protein
MGKVHYIRRNGRRIAVETIDTSEACRGAAVEVLPPSRSRI